MARKRGEYQRRKERRGKIASVFILTFFLFAFFITLYFLVQEAVNVRDIDNDSLNTYTGSFQYELRASPKRKGGLKYHYVFILDNGDVVGYNRRWMENEDLIDNCEELTFQYSTMLSNPLYGQYSAVSITSTDGETTILNMDRSRSQSVTGIWACSVILALCLGMLVGYLVILFYARDWKNRYQKWRKQRKKMKDRQL